jgi:hypothetical protein
LRPIRFVEQSRSAGNFTSFAQDMHQLPCGQGGTDSIFRIGIPIGFQCQRVLFQTARCQRDVVGNAYVELLNVVGDPVVSYICALGNDYQLRRRILARTQPAIADQIGFQIVTRSDSYDLVLYWADIRIYISGDHMHIILCIGEFVAKRNNRSMLDFKLRCCVCGELATKELTSPQPKFDGYPK